MIIINASEAIDMTRQLLLSTSSAVTCPAAGHHCSCANSAKLYCLVTDAHRHE